MLNDLRNFGKKILSGSLKGIRNASTRTVEIMSIAKLTRNIEAMHLDKAEKKDSKICDSDLVGKSRLLQRLKKKTASTQIKVPEPNVLSYKEPKLYHKEKKSSLRTDSIKSFIKENIKNVCSDLEIQKSKEQALDVSEKYINYNKNDIKQEDTIQKTQRKQPESKSAKTTYKNKLSKSAYVYEAKNQEKTSMEVVVKKYIQQTLIPWRPSSVSMNDF
ncbi:unnamed protein product [Pneumocystis jirovecii]|uniref:Uncharacterized protein n=1 Tax=Pneumocystis jirovecii TaxID=42068 RepID=L0P9Q2_PNEJI|nr:unnamed protein product [Pneumocystis jirovecii]